MTKAKASPRNGSVPHAILMVAWRSWGLFSQPRASKRYLSCDKTYISTVRKYMLVSRVAAIARVKRAESTATALLFAISQFMFAITLLGWNEDHV